MRRRRHTTDEKLEPRHPGWWKKWAALSAVGLAAAISYWHLTRNRNDVDVDAWKRVDKALGYVPREELVAVSMAMNTLYGAINTRPQTPLDRELNFILNSLITGLGRGDWPLPRTLLHRVPRLIKEGNMLTHLPVATPDIESIKSALEASSIDIKHKKNISYILKKLTPYQDAHVVKLVLNGIKEELEPKKSIFSEVM